MAPNVIKKQVEFENALEYLTQCHDEWKPILVTALEKVDPNYFQQLLTDTNWLPGLSKLFAAFSLPLSKTQYILLGESPYPRAQSANGYAFWDNSVQDLWSSQGLSKQVNKATSFRHLIKMLLVARGDLSLNNTTQEAITLINKNALVQTANELFQKMMEKGILLLNACPVYSEGKVSYHARFWQPFMQSLFEQLTIKRPTVKLILLGKIAQKIHYGKLSLALVAEHPYNVSFVSNSHVIDFFKQLDLLSYE